MLTSKAENIQRVRALMKNKRREKLSDKLKQVHEQTAAAASKHEQVEQNVTCLAMGLDDV